ncbi:hypothetical protein KC19_6G092600 [Ceratodon purpureus]|uniref:Uncharacterized protein n=1 Tax=Ceratodon purpureus TaxID=3225 RepID=A0A8T0HFR7_CERPU|nr:hypothetical protein KC19_6G092600 [Ceratodon purpureus]
MGDLQAPMEWLRRMNSTGELAGKVSAAWGALQFDPELADSLPLPVVAAIDRCKNAFAYKEAGAITREIHLFYLHHDDVLLYQSRQRDFDGLVEQVQRNRAAFVAEKLSRYDIKIRMQEEDEEWVWSPVFREFKCEPQPRCISRPYEHSEEEFEGLVKWMEMEGNRIGEKNEPPHMARALKLFAKSELGSRTPMLCPVLGLTEETMTDRGHQILVAMQELIRVGKIYFPTMDTQSDTFETFRLVLDDCVDRGGEVAQYHCWGRDTFVKACLDMLALDKKSLLRDMWVTREGVDFEAVSNAFRIVLLYRENLDLGYIFGSLEATGTWPAAGHGLFRAAKELLQDSLHHLHGKLQVWNVTDDLEDLDEWKASQVLCTIDQERIFGLTHQPAPSNQQEEPSRSDRSDPWDFSISPRDPVKKHCVGVAEPDAAPVLEEEAASCDPVVQLPAV